MRTTTFFTFSLCRLACLLGLAGGLVDAQAITNSTTTSAFTSLGNFSGGLNGEQISANWVLTAAHVAAGLTTGTSTYTNGNGASVIDQVVMFDGANNFPDNDIALVHLSTAIGTSSIASLNDTVLDATTFGQTAFTSPIQSVTLANSLSSSQRSYGTSSPYGTETTDTNNKTVNYLITSGNSDLVSGDSGSALFSGTVTDSTGQVLLGVASGITTTLGTTYSYFVQTASYKSWIDSTMSSSGQQPTWVSAVPETSTSLAMLTGLGCLTLVAVRRRLSHARVSPNR